VTEYRASWAGMSTAEIQAEYDNAVKRGDSDWARRARGALYRRGVRVKKPPGSGSDRHPKHFGKAAKDRVEAMLRAAEALMMEVGIQSADERTPKKAIKEASETPSGETPSLATIATIHEFGTKASGGRIPERSYLRSTAAEHGRSWVRGLARVVQEYGSDDVSRAAQRLLAVGIQARNQIQAKIRSNIPPELSDTVKAERTRRGIEPVALIATGQLIGSIRAEADTPEGRKDLGGYNRGGA